MLSLHSKCRTNLVHTTVLTYLVERKYWYVLGLHGDAIDDDLSVPHLVEAQEDPGHVGQDEEGDDGDGDVSHVDLARVPVGAPLVEEDDALADAHV